MWSKMASGRPAQLKKQLKSCSPRRWVRTLQGFSEPDNDPAWLDDLAELLRDTAIMASDSDPSTHNAQDPEPTLREIFAAITPCNTN